MSKNNPFTLPDPLNYLSRMLLQLSGSDPIHNKTSCSCIVFTIVTPRRWDSVKYLILRCVTKLGATIRFSLNRVSLLFGRHCNDGALGDRAEVFCFFFDGEDFAAAHGLALAGLDHPGPRAN